MKIFWSWQSDTPGKIGRHFVRDVLAEAIKILKETDNIVEPAERDTRNKLHLDHDRQGVPGSPDLAPTIFGKINNSSVFIADVTLVAATCSVEADDETGRTRKFINANVAIEFGYALKALGDEFILMIQNVHYGDRDELPFDLKHKAGLSSIALHLAQIKREFRLNSEDCAEPSSMHCVHILHGCERVATHLENSKRYQRRAISLFFGNRLTS